MSRRLVAVTAVLALVAAGCAQEPADVALGGPASNSGAIPRCEEVPGISAPQELYRETPIYVGNEMPVEEVQAWAESQPGFGAIWIDRDLNGWVTVGFTEDVEQRQADIEELFPDDGVVAVALQHPPAELQSLQNRVARFLSGHGEQAGVGSYDNRGVVGVAFAVLEPRLVDLLASEFAGEPLCVEGLDPEDAPTPGPQPEGGDGWRLLADEARLGESYRTGIATDQAQLAELWLTVGLDSEIPEVDFETEIVIWFGAVFGSSCPDIRLDDVVVVGDLVHAEIVLATPALACTDDAVPHAYLVAVDRSKLPKGPFRIQLGADDPRGTVADERTLVDADLSVPGSVAGPDQVGGDHTPPEPHFVQSGDIIEPGYPVPYRLYTHCGIEWLGELNDVVWRTSEDLPAEWEAVIESEVIELQVTMRTGNPPTVEASANGATITYEPTTEPVPGCD